MFSATAFSGRSLRFSWVSVRWTKNNDFASRWRDLSRSRAWPALDQGVLLLPFCYQQPVDIVSFDSINGCHDAISVEQMSTYICESSDV